MFILLKNEKLVAHLVFHDRLLLPISLYMNKRVG